MHMRRTSSMELVTAELPMLALILVRKLRPGKCHRRVVSHLPLWCAARPQVNCKGKQVARAHRHTRTAADDLQLARVEACARATHPSARITVV